MDCRCGGGVGNKQAATVGQVCFRFGEAKNAYGAGNLVLGNTGETPVLSKAGLLTTVCYKFGEFSARVRARRLSCRDRVSGAVASPAISSASSPRRLMSKRLANTVTGQWRRLFRPGILRSVRALLARRRSRRDRWLVAVQQPRVIWRAQLWKRFASRHAQCSMR